MQFIYLGCRFHKTAVLCRINVADLWSCTACIFSYPVDRIMRVCTKDIATVLGEREWFAHKF